MFSKSEWALFAVGGLCAVTILGIGIAQLFKPSSSTQAKRPLEHYYGATMTVEAPGMPQGAHGVYFKWCDDGYMMFANGFAETSPITAVKDARCEGVH